MRNEAGERAFKVDGKALRVRDTLVIEDPSGGELFSIQEKKLRIHDTMKIERGGQTVATVKKGVEALRKPAPAIAEPAARR